METTAKLHLAVPFPIFAVCEDHGNVWSHISSVESFVVDAHLLQL